MDNEGFDHITLDIHVRWYISHIEALSFLPVSAAGMFSVKFSVSTPAPADLDLVLTNIGDFVYNGYPLNIDGYNYHIVATSLHFGDYMGM